jgi:hypothetical protein
MKVVAVTTGIVTLAFVAYMAFMAVFSAPHISGSPLVAHNPNLQPADFREPHERQPAGAGRRDGELAQ